MKATTFPEEARIPALIASPLPRFNPNSTTMSAPAARAAPAVPSSEPSSTTRISAPPSASTVARAARSAVTVPPMRPASW